MRQCTWKECEREGLIPQLDNGGKEWALLCQEHHNEIEDSIQSDPFSPKRLVSAWVKAQGGAKSASDRLFYGKR